MRTLAFVFAPVVVLAACSTVTTRDGDEPKQSTHEPLVSSPKRAQPPGVAQPTLACHGEGARCDYSLQCCTGICNDGYCWDPGSTTCHGEGAHCDYSFQCCTGICDDGSCNSFTGACKGPGVACQGSYECCEGFCNGDACSDF